MKLTEEIFQAVGNDYCFASGGVLKELLEGLSRWRRTSGWSRDLTEEQAIEIGWFPYCGDELLRSQRESNNIIFCPGSFNPIHEGHMSMPRELIKKIGDGRSYHIIYLPAAWEYSSKKPYQIFDNDRQRAEANQHRISTIGDKLGRDFIASETYWRFSGAAPVDLNFLTIINMFLDSIKRRYNDHYFCVIGADNQLHLLGLKYLPDYVQPVLCERNGVEISERMNEIDDLIRVTNPFNISSTKIRKQVIDSQPKIVAEPPCTIRCIAEVK